MLKKLIALNPQLKTFLLVNNTKYYYLFAWSCRLFETLLSSYSITDPGKTLTIQQIMFMMYESITNHTKCYKTYFQFLQGNRTLECKSFIYIEENFIDCEETHHLLADVCKPKNENTTITVHKYSNVAYTSYSYFQIPINSMLVLQLTSTTSRQGKQR